MTWNSGTMGGSAAGVANYPPPDVPGRRRRPHPAMQDREGLVEGIIRPGEKALHWRRTPAGEQTSAKSFGNAAR